MVFNLKGRDNRTDFMDESSVVHPTERIEITGESMAAKAEV